MSATGHRAQLELRICPARLRAAPGAWSSHPNIGAPDLDDAQTIGASGRSNRAALGAPDELETRKRQRLVIGEYRRQSKG
jgi:hypothetical protein